MQSVQRGTRIVRIQKNTTQVLDHPNTNSFTGFGFNFTAASVVPGLTTLYEQYKLAAIRIIIRPLRNVALYSASATNVTNLPICYAKFDSNDSVAPTTVDEFLESNNYKSWVGSHQKVFFFKPNYLADVNASGGDEAVLQSRQGWLATTPAGLGIQHFGFKFGVQSDIGHDAEQFRMEVRYYVMAKTAI